MLFPVFNTVLDPRQELLENPELVPRRRRICDTAVGKELVIKRGLNVLLPNKTRIRKVKAAFELQVLAAEAGDTIMPLWCPARVGCIHHTRVLTVTK
jgi:hypothetical protein